MMSSASPRLLMISGPIASGKSTVARALGKLAREQGLTVALTDLDTVAEMALPTLPDWEWAHATHARLVAAWLETTVDVVIDEGTSNRHEVSLMLTALPPDVSVFHVILTSPFALAHARALADPARGLSKNREFLRRDHDAFAGELPHLPCDLRLDVEGKPADEIAAHIWRAHQAASTRA